MDRSPEPFETMAARNDSTPRPTAVIAPHPAIVTATSGIQRKLSSRDHLTAAKHFSGHEQHWAQPLPLGHGNLDHRVEGWDLVNHEARNCGEHSPGWSSRASWQP